MPDETEGFEETAEAETRGEGDRLTRIEERLDTLAAAVSRLIPGSHKEAQQRTEERLDRPSTIEEKVREELARRDREAALKSAQDEAQSLGQRVARLEEKPPEPPERRSTRVMWGSIR